MLKISNTKLQKHKKVTELIIDEIHKLRLVQSLKYIFFSSFAISEHELEASPYFSTYFRISTMNLMILHFITNFFNHLHMVFFPPFFAFGWKTPALVFPKIK